MQNVLEKDIAVSAIAVKSRRSTIKTTVAELVFALAILRATRYAPLSDRVDRNDRE